MLNLITWFMNQVMVHEALQQAGAAPYERTDERKAHRNGYKERSLKIRYGSATLKKPQFREFPFETEVFGRYALVEKALVNAIAESYLQGVPTRKVQDIVQHLGIEQLSPASTSRMAKDLDEQVQAFLQRPIEQEMPYLFVDASYYKVRDGARYVTKDLLVTAGVRDNGFREILPGLMIYTAFPKNRGKRIRTMNLMERVNKEPKRRTKVLGAFPNEDALFRLAGSILMDINEEWITDRRYLTVEKE